MLQNGILLQQNNKTVPDEVISPSGTAASFYKNISIFCLRHHHMAIRAVIRFRLIPADAGGQSMPQADASLGCFICKHRRLTILGNPVQRLSAVVEISRLHFLFAVWTFHARSTPFSAHSANSDFITFTILLELSGTPEPLEW